MYLRFRGCPVVLDIELSVSAWYPKTRRALLRARCLVLLLRERRCAVCGITLKMEWKKKKNDFVPIRTRRNPAAAKNTPTSKSIFLFYKKLKNVSCEYDRLNG